MTEEEQNQHMKIAISAIKRALEDKVPGDSDPQWKRQAFLAALEIRGELESRGSLG